MEEVKINIDHRKLGDFYWKYADILRSYGVTTATYDQRVMAFMALKLLVDNNKVLFNFEYKNNFGLCDADLNKYQGKNTQETFLNIIRDLANLGYEQNLKYFSQEAKYNPREKDYLNNPDYKPEKKESILAYVNHKRIFNLTEYVEELSNKDLENVLDIYNDFAHFVDYPKEKYMGLYEEMIARMKTMTGDLTGQHFTQKSITHLMCEVALQKVKKNKKIAIYDPACGTGSMLMEAAYYFVENFKKSKKKTPEIEIFGQEVHGQTWLLCKIFLEICSLDGSQQGIPNVIACGSTLTEPAFTDGINGADSFDFIIANPPFGVDWKHSYDQVVANMISKDSHFYEVRDHKNKPVTPRKNDGQFLFMMHILKLMEKESAKGKTAFAAVISSSTLISNGTETSAEANIRRRIFQDKRVDAVIEQPNGMFTNTDISSHIWFLSTENNNKIRLLKTDTPTLPLYDKHPAAEAKMKHTYSPQNIQDILKKLNAKKTTEYVSADADPNKVYRINLSTEIGRPDPFEDADLDAIETEIDGLLGLLSNMKFSA